MKIKLHSFGTPESRDFRCILEGMYRKVGEVESVEFPNKETIELIIRGEFDYQNEYGIHRMDRISPRYPTQWKYKSYVLVEIDGRTREELTCVYDFNPHKVKNILNGQETTDLYGVLGGKPLGLRPIFVPSKIQVPEFMVSA